MLHLSLAYKNIDTFANVLHDRQRTIYRMPGARIMKFFKTILITVLLTSLMMFSGVTVVRNKPEYPTVFSQLD